MPPITKISPKRKFITRALLSLFVFILVLELAVRLTAFFSPSFKSWIGSTVEGPAVLVPFSGQSSPVLQKDSRGFRNSETLSQADFVVIGDEAVVGEGIDEKATWPKTLAQLTDQNVYNMGRSQTGPADYLLLVKQALELKPKQVILALHLGDDFFDAFDKVYRDEQFKDWRSADTARLDSMTALQNQKPFELTRESSAGVFQASTGSPWMSVKMTRKLLKAESPSDLLAKSNLAGKLKEDFAKIDREDVRITEGIALTLTALSKAAEEIRAANAEPLVILIPSSFCLLSSDKVPAESAPAYARALEQEGFAREKMRDYMKTTRVPFIDLYLPFLDASHENRLLTDLNADWSPAAHELIAAEVAGWIKEQSFRDDHGKANASIARKEHKREKVQGGERKLFFGFILLMGALTVFLTKLRAKGRPLFFAIFYGLIVFYQLWTPTDFFPFSSTLFMNTPRQRPVLYRKLTAVLQDGTRMNVPLSEILPSLGGTRTSFLVRKAVQNPPLADSLATAIAVAYDRKLGGMESPRIREIRFEEWKWDFARDPFDPDKGYVLKRVIGRPAQEAPHA